MKRLPKLPYIQNIVNHYQALHGDSVKWLLDGSYSAWLKTLGFIVPTHNDYLEFPDSFSDEELALFILRWS